MKFRAALLALIITTLAAGCAVEPKIPPALESKTSAASGGAYKISAGDVLSIAVYGHDDLSGEYVVSGDGKISIPLINQVRASGLTASELQARLVERLQPDYLRNPDVGVKLVSYRPIYVLGEVQNAGSFSYQPNLTVISAIALAGGYSYRAAKKKLSVIHADENNQKKVPVTESTKLQPGDTLIIPQRLF